MPFILGGTQYNKDPKKLAKWNCYDHNIEQEYRHGNSEGSYESGEANFWSSNLIVNGSVTSASVADTARTLVNISGKSGWLCNGFGPVGANQSGTWVITVDGIATTITMPHDSGPTDNYEMRTGFGLMVHSSLVGGANIPYVWVNPGNTADAKWYDTNSVLQYSGNESGYTNFRWKIMNPHWLVNAFPDACVRFEDSLTVTVASDVANSTSIQQNAGVIYILDA